jgi:hypothetical protein
MTTREEIMRILAIIQGEYGQRHVENIRRHGPADWTVEVWRAPAVLPPVIDYPEDYLPASLPPADLVLALGEHPGVAELVPDVVRLCGAQAVIAPIDNNAWLPTGLARQLGGWLAEQGVATVFPKPFCSLTETHVGVRRFREAYNHPLIREFAHYFGQPELRITCDPETRTIVAAEVVRDAACGCARYVAERLVGVHANDAEQEAGMLHHHYPCLASMGIDPDFDDTLMHVSGNILRNSVATQVKPFKDIPIFVPTGRVE